MSEIRNGMGAIHPGEIVREEFLVPLNLSANALAKQGGARVAELLAVTPAPTIERDDAAKTS